MAGLNYGYLEKYATTGPTVFKYFIFLFSCTYRSLTLTFRFDLKKALESSKNLPNFAQKSVDVDALESR